MNPITRMVVQRLVLGLLTMLAVSVVIFAAIAMLPGDFARAVLGQSATPETIAAFQRELGLDRPIVERYLEWIWGAVQGDFGESFASAGSLNGHARTVASLVEPRLANTFFLGAIAAVIAVPLSLALGILTALYQNSIFDRAVNLISLTAVSVPEFFVAYVLMLFLAIKFPILYSLANVTEHTPLGERLARCMLPAMTLVVVNVAHMMRMTRAAIINLLGAPFIEMARLKGASPLRVIVRHALPNAWAPIAMVIAVNLAYLIVGVVIVEVVFVYPGIGRLMVDAVSARDVPVVQACALVFAATYVIFNVLADVAAIASNPRLLYPR